eukprot:1148778-Pelagomonas_calceolata.AAC.7
MQKGWEGQKKPMVGGRDAKGQKRAEKAHDGRVWWRPFVAVVDCMVFSKSQANARRERGCVWPAFEQAGAPMSAEESSMLRAN